jgi:hypothetical protein
MPIFIVLWFIGIFLISDIDVTIFSTSILDRILKFSGKKDSLSLHLVEIDIIRIHLPGIGSGGPRCLSRSGYRSGKMMSIRQDPDSDLDPQYWLFISKFNSPWPLKLKERKKKHFQGFQTPKGVSLGLGVQDLKNAAIQWGVSDSLTGRI